MRVTDIILLDGGMGQELATVQTTNTYAIHHDRLAGTGLEDQFVPLHQAALKEAAGMGTIAGSIGPLIASYRPDIHPAYDVAVPLYTEIAQLLAAEVDLIICETISSIAHGAAILAAAKSTGKPVWLAFTVDDTDGSKLRSGEAVSEVLQFTDADAILIYAMDKTLPRARWSSRARADVLVVSPEAIADWETNCVGKAVRKTKGGQSNGR